MHVHVVALALCGITTGMGYSLGQLAVQDVLPPDRSAEGTSVLLTVLISVGGIAVVAAAVVEATTTSATSGTRRSGMRRPRFYLRSHPIPDGMAAHAAAVEENGWDGLLLTDSQNLSMER